jgi:hypothetical protein
MADPRLCAGQERWISLKGRTYELASLNTRLAGQILDLHSEAFNMCGDAVQVVNTGAGALEQLSRLSGHSTREMFDRYNQIDTEDLKEAVAQTRRFLAGIDRQPVFRQRDKSWFWIKLL